MATWCQAPSDRAPLSLGQGHRARWGLRQGQEVPGPCAFENQVGGTLVQGPGGSWKSRHVRRGVCLWPRSEPTRPGAASSIQHRGQGPGRLPRREAQDTLTGPITWCLGPPRSSWLLTPGTRPRHAHILPWAILTQGLVWPQYQGRQGCPHQQLGALSTVLTAARTRPGHSASGRPEPALATG